MDCAAWLVGSWLLLRLSGICLLWLLAPSHWLPSQCLCRLRHIKLIRARLHLIQIQWGILSIRHPLRCLHWRLLEWLIKHIVVGGVVGVPILISRILGHKLILGSVRLIQVLPLWLVVVNRLLVEIWLQVINRYYHSRALGDSPSIVLEFQSFIAEIWCALFLLAWTTCRLFTFTFPLVLFDFLF